MTTTTTTTTTTGDDPGTRNVTETDCEGVDGGEEGNLCHVDCSNRGVCLRGDKCLCLPGFGGSACSQVTGGGGGSLQDKVCPHSCSGHGACVLGTCVCDKFYSGPDCAARAEPRCDHPAGCSEHGRCVNGLCVCEPGFTGSACDRAVECPYGCRGRGTCHRGSCFCDPGFGEIGRAHV